MIKEILEMVDSPRMDPEYLAAKRAVRKLSQSYERIRRPEVKEQVPEMRMHNDIFESQEYLKAKARAAVRQLHRVQAAPVRSNS